MKNKGSQCQVDGCINELPAYAVYYQRYRICAAHAAVPELEREGRMQRFCQQCGRFHELDAFDGLRKTCRRKLEMHNAQRKRARDAARSVASEPASPASSGGTAAPPRRKSHDAAIPRRRSHDTFELSSRRHGVVKPTFSVIDEAAPRPTGPSNRSGASTSSGPSSAGERAPLRPGATTQSRPPTATDDTGILVNTTQVGRSDPALAMSMDLDAILGVDLNALLPPAGSLPLAPAPMAAGAWLPAVNVSAPMRVDNASNGGASGSGADAVTTGMGLPMGVAMPLPAGLSPLAPVAPAASAPSLPRHLPGGLSPRLVNETSTRMFGVLPNELPAPLYEALMSVLKSNFLGDGTRI